ncbi:hypothetical protein NQ317_019357 [Molorchus minor]|uniref:Mpv17-like protein 2 n=1 Tax=Molorchus minor TaxID=1323400 RepID=A0ABQ9JA77_9CUCU|nr:hypothetical protein NQ317_019357 [Molorchus minor]
MSVGLGINIVKSIKSFVMPTFGKFINKAFSDKYLLFTNVGISITLSGLGDVLEQHYEMATDQIEKWDHKRTMNMSLSGTSVGVVCHYWYKYLDKIMPGYTIKMVLKKIVVDQFIGSPICISTFFVTIGWLEGSSKQELMQEMKHKAWKLYVAEWIIWPPAQFINFYLLPTKFRVLFDNTVSLGYDVYTSHVKHDIQIDKSSKRES